MIKIQSKNIDDVFIGVPYYLVLFTVMFFYFGFFADYVPYYQEKTTLFLFSSDYLKEHFNQPGSPLIYLGNLITTFFKVPFAGSVLISVIISLSVYVLSRIMSFQAGKKHLVVPFLSGAVFFYLQASYQFSVFNSIGLLLQLSFFYLTVRYLKGWLPVMLFPLWYYLTGGFSWIFLIMFSIYSGRKSIRQEWPKIFLLWTLAFITIYVLKQFLLFQPVSALLTWPYTDEGTGYQSWIFIAYMAAISVLPFISGISINIFRNIKVPSIGQKLVPPAVLFVALITVSGLRFDKKIRQYFMTEKLFFEGKYNKVMEYVKKNPSNNLLTIYLNNIALCEIGRLNDQLFQNRQDPEGRTLFLKWEMSGEILRRGGYFYYAIGMINEAQRWAYENMIMKGLTPEDLRMLIRTEIINGNYDIASKYVSVLKKAAFYRGEAKGYEKLLFNDRAVDSDPALGIKRKEKIQNDFFSITDDPYINVERILSRDSLNRKAFEYRLAYMLLKKDYRGVESQLQQLPEFGFIKIPVHIDEAAEAYKTLNMGPLPYQGSLRPDPETAQRFNRFLQTFQQFGNNLKSAEPALRQKFGNTFWYYAFYH